MGGWRETSGGVAKNSSCPITFNSTILLFQALSRRQVTGLYGYVFGCVVYRAITQTRQETQHVHHQDPPCGLEQKGGLCAQALPI